ncbi:MAG: hypothetical protein Pg6A_15200 [Termitinemataceae bacterium]|nr:MAG: hypothetical protein Pg6A_15200 [Termitinemataceae bacterium]
MKKIFCVTALLAAGAVCFAQSAAAPSPTGNSSEIRDVLSGKNFCSRSVGLIQETWYVTFNYDGTYKVTAAGTIIAKGKYSLSGTTVNLMPVDTLKRSDVFGLWQGAIDSAENPTQLKWNLAVYKLVTDKQ